MNIIPDYIEPITAYRAWQVNDKGELKAMAWGRTWPAKEIARALCHAEESGLARFAQSAPKKMDVGRAVRAGMIVDHEAPHEGCDCGLYAHKDANGSYIVSAKKSPDRAWGEVYLWGRLLEHENGYKAQFAYPKSLTTNSQYAALIAERYGVPCEYVDPATIDGYNESGNYIVTPLGSLVGQWISPTSISFSFDDSQWVTANGAATTALSTVTKEKPEEKPEQKRRFSRLLSAFGR